MSPSSRPSVAPSSDAAAPVPSTAVEAPSADAVPGRTRRTFVKGIAAAGASTAVAVALDAAGATHLVEEADAAPAVGSAFSDFRAIGASSADRFEVPEGYRADVLISWDDEFVDGDGVTLKWGFNNDFLAWLPIAGKPDEALLFSNHEYPGPFFQHGVVDPTKKTDAQIRIEKDSVGNSVLHIRRDREGVWQVVSPSSYNRRITGDAPACPITGPLSGETAVQNPPRTPGAGPGAGTADPDDTANVGTISNGSLANCSGGITPWGTVLSCEENYADYPSKTGFGYGWKEAEYDARTHAKYGWVVEHDPYDPSSTPRKHTALGRFRHENTAFRAAADKPFVLYMGDDKVNEGVYKFVSSRRYRPGQRANNLKILEEGTLYVARWSPEGRRRFAADGDTTPLTAESGTGTWVEVMDSELVDTSGWLRQRFGTTVYDAEFATNRPEDVEVDEDGAVYVSFTNNATVKDQHGAIRRLDERGGDPTATSFTWRDYAEGGPSGRDLPGEQGFSCCDNLVFDAGRDLWTVTDISSSSLKNSASAKPWYDYHGNNAIFHIPRSGPNAGVAFRFANMPVEAEGTGPYFSGDGSTLFVNVQHPGEETPSRGGVYGDASTYTSWWPAGDRTAGGTPALPRPSTVAVTKVPVKGPGAGGGTPTIPDPGPGSGGPGSGGPGGPGPGGPGGVVDTDRPAKTTVDVRERISAKAFTTKGISVRYGVRTRARVRLVVRVTLPRLRNQRARTLPVARWSGTVDAGTYERRLRPSRIARLALGRRAGRRLAARVELTVDPVGEGRTLRRSDRFRIGG